MDDEAEVRTGSRNRRESVGASCATQPDDTTGILASFASTQPFASLPTTGNGITVSTPGGALPNAD